MPELPEVEIVKRSLIKNVKSEKILRVIVRNRNLRFKLPKNFKNIIEKQIIINVKRFSKYVIIEFLNKLYCIIHLGMSGTIHIVKLNSKKRLVTNSSFYHSPFLPNKHNHIELIFKNFRLIYNDPRRFGYFKILTNTQKLNNFINSYGVEPFDKKFDFKYVKKNLKIKIKISKITFWIKNLYPE